MPRINPEQFAKQKDQMLKEQRTTDAAWAKEQYVKMGGDEKAYDFKPAFTGQTYEQQRYGAKPVK
jgi:hypothetical protein